MKNIIITGTSRGIGLELVKILADQGHQILALSRNTAPIKKLNLKNVYALEFDLAQPSHYNLVAEFIATKFKTIEVLINNAGTLINKPFTETSYADFKHVYNTNVFGVAEMVKTMLPFSHKQTHVVTVSSMGGIQGSSKFPGLAAYSSSKGAVITLSELLAEEFKDNGPRFNVLALGAVQTEMLEEAFPGYIAPLSAIEMANYIAEFALSGHKFYNGKVLQVANSTP